MVCYHIDRVADLGHTVVGVEISEIGSRDFFKEQNVEYAEVKKVSGFKGGTLFKVSSLYCR